MSRKTKKKLVTGVLPELPELAPVLIKHSHPVWKWVKRGLIFFIAVLVTLLVVAGIFAYSYFHTVVLNAQMSDRKLFSIVKAGLTAKLDVQNGRQNILILGIDELANRDTNSINTDTMMVASINVKTGKIDTVSVQRDLFLADKKVKINGLYQIGLDQKNPHPEDLSKQAMEQVTGLPIQHVIIVQLGELGKLIDAVGGVDVTVERSFTDTRFPRPDVDVRVVHDPNQLYETVNFTQGMQHMDGTVALEFVRSRHSLDPVEGTDDARAKRQQLVLSAVLQKLLNPSLVKKPAFVGFLLYEYEHNFASYLPIEQVIALGKTFGLERVKPVLNRHVLPIRTDDPIGGVLYHPDKFPGGVWVYLPVDPTYKQIRSLVQSWVK
jgi:LCP family protein required for cell wall assembly